VDEELGVVRHEPLQGNRRSPPGDQPVGRLTSPSASARIVGARAVVRFRCRAEPCSCFVRSVSGRPVRMGGGVPGVNPRRRSTCGSTWSTSADRPVIPANPGRVTASDIRSARRSLAGGAELMWLMCSQFIGVDCRSAFCGSKRSWIIRDHGAFSGSGENPDRSDMSDAPSMTLRSRSVRTSDGSTDQLLPGPADTLRDHRNWGLDSALRVAA
jgi:hypothetical protein